ncbi:winged helix-turn-helix domain-containing protein [Chitinophaga arvensicola]|uniref:winged helix-turn-helix domain-containing protein n=1 Tax=Chitinophaga arvensicola TaxID=29529 RepID=UPI001FDF5EFE|nr:helix-turn-helix domain-containing protein [Chitinophaga arvensicola]
MNSVLLIEDDPNILELLAIHLQDLGCETASVMKSYSRKRLLNLLWGYDFEGYEHTVNAHIKRLRSNIEKDISHPEFILTTWAVGYRFNEEL